MSNIHNDDNVIHESIKKYISFNLPGIISSRKKIDFHRSPTGCCFLYVICDMFLGSSKPLHIYSIKCNKKKLIYIK